MSLILQELQNSILTISLNRPEKRNSFTEPMARELQKIFNRAKEEDVRVVLLKAEGKAFCSGQDLTEVVDRAKTKKYKLSETVRSSFNPIIQAIRNLQKPVVCAVQGAAAGAGANIAFACDIVLASDDAVFLQAFNKIGLIPDSGGTFFLPRLAGLARANAIYMLDEKITAEQAVEYGLIYRSVPHDLLEKEVLAICEKLAQMPTKGFGLYKEAINRSFTNTLDQQLEAEAELQAKAGNTRDYKEGIDAFLNKRKPEFKGI